MEEKPKEKGKMRHVYFATCQSFKKKMVDKFDQLCWVVVSKLKDKIKFAIVNRP